MIDSLVAAFASLELDPIKIVIIAAEMLRRSRLRCYGVPRCAATR